MFGVVNRRHLTDELPGVIVSRSQYNNCFHKPRVTMRLAGLSPLIYRSLWALALLPGLACLGPVVVLFPTVPCRLKPHTFALMFPLLHFIFVV